MFQGEEFVFKEDWGEQLVGKHISVLCILDIEKEEVSVLEAIPDNISAGLVTRFANNFKNKLKRA